MPTIRQLPQAVINKIAAGEVIERPASVVKELMENAVDSGATRIDVTVVKGGAELIRVVDNGCGIAAEQLQLAVASHATSKIEDADDLFSVGTMGFRGEALASISEVSRFTIRSRPADADSGMELHVEGGHRGELEPCGMPPGTGVEVRDLFFNTPVRRKFLKTTQTELGHVTEAFARIALAWPDRHFRLAHGDRVIHDLPPVARWKERITALFDPALNEALIPVAGEHGELRLSGYVADPSYNRSHTRMQYLLLNGRFIRDRALQHALAEAYRGLLLTGRYPVSFLRLDMPPDWVDVNVHPTKLEVRFQDSGQIYRHLLNTIRSQFLSTDLTARVAAPASPPVGNSTSAESGPAAPPTTRLVTSSPRQLPWERPSRSGPSAPAVSGYQRPAPTPLPTNIDHSSPLPTEEPSGMGEASHRVDPAGDPHSASSFPSSTRGMQLQNRYIITEDTAGVVIIDQHALHERILYERLRERVTAGEIEQQKLLVPATVHLRPEEHALLLEHAELLRELGVDIESFGGTTIAITAYPALLGSAAPEAILRQLVETLQEKRDALERRDLLDEILHMMACKAAVKAGDQLSQEEVEALLEQRHLCHDAHHCPHGRPTALVFTREELDRRFQRT